MELRCHTLVYARSKVECDERRGMQAARDHGTAATGSIAEEGEVGSGEFQAEAGVCTQHVAGEEGFFGNGSVACRLVEVRGVGGLGGLGRAGEVVPCSDDVGGEVLGEVGVCLEGGQGEFQVLIWYDTGCEGSFLF
jgi:hypothetical protein